MRDIPKLFPAWFVYETVLPLLREDGWRRVEHRENKKSGFRETIFLDPHDQHRPTAFALGAFSCTGHWFAFFDLSDPNPTWGVIDPATQKTFIITARPNRDLGRPTTYSLPTADTYIYPGEYVTNC